MKKYITVLAIAFALLSILQSCDKEEQDAPRILNKVIEVNLHMNETYQLKMDEKVYGGDLKISVQADHFLLSKFQMTSRPMNSKIASPAVYEYSPSHNYVGEDQVTITSEGDDEQEGCDRSERQDHHSKEGRHNKKDDDDDDDDDEVTIITTIHFHIIKNPIQNQY